MKSCFSCAGLCLCGRGFLLAFGSIARGASDAIHAKVRFLALMFFFVSLSANATTWYVDSGATGTSANKGTNWANAWTNIYSISGVKPGDVVYFS